MARCTAWSYTVFGQWIMQDGQPWELESQELWETQAADADWAYALIGPTTWGCENLCDLQALEAESGESFETEDGLILEVE